MTRKQLKICAAVGAAATRPHNTRQTSCERANKIFAGVSLTSIMNSFYWQLMLVVLVVSCDMCKSNEYPVTSSKTVTATATATDSGEIGGEITIDTTTNLLDPYTGGGKEDSIGEYLKSEKEKFLGSNLIRNATIENVTEECRTHCNLQVSLPLYIVHYCNENSSNQQLKNNI
ncbi:uncharacterized protein LOC118748413 [Rhagoletis pomonella]|uniref:uncharacterized protein LOC118748413 n=1 Tax=Rhagoletis pomonella TaxID=28610 RepID=UPI001783D16C|nr:uncharacterized protein LOC118748413 [Rhagoletis pomonella]XP_036338695.1 uncharacterized protein LOC118748413 [Rhagoletis pomonella]